MKRRIFSSITALALCLSLLPGTALAEGDGPVTITGTKDSGGPAVVLEEGKTYVADETTGGVKEAPADTSEPYLRYSAGVLYVYSVVQIEGTMAVTSDLALRLVGAAANARLDLVDNSSSLSTTLSLNGHTMTLDCYITLSVVSTPHAAVDSGTFVYAPYTGGGDFEQSANKIEIVSDTTAAAQNLTIKDAGDVTIQGNTSTGGVVEKLTVENSQVTVEQRDTSNPDPVVNNLTTDAPITVKKGDVEKVMTPGGDTWKNGGDFTGTPSFNMLTEATCYKADKGWIYYKPAVAATGEPAVLTLDGVETNHAICYDDTPTKIVAKGVNKIISIQAGTPPEVDQTDGSLCAIVDVTTAGDVHEATVYGNVSELGSINGTSLPIPLTKLTFAPGATLTIPDGQYLLISYSPQLESGKIINNGEFTVQYTEGDFSNFSEYIQSLNLTGSGKVVARKTPSGGGSYVESYYNNEGVSIKTSVDQLDLHNFLSYSEYDKLAEMGYKWTANPKTLTLDGLSANVVTLLDDTVTIEVIGASTIRELKAEIPSGGSISKAHPIFTGSAPLTVQQQINIAGGDSNALTVAEGATLIANGGISIGASGVVNSVVTVNGTLTAKGGVSAALGAGSVKIGEKGTLNVSGARGVSLNGMPKLTGNEWTKLFAMERGATFSADCTEGNIQIANATSVPAGFEAKDAFDFPEGYELGDCEPRFNGNNIDLFRISTNQVYKGPLSIHEVHDFSRDWTWDTANHWHVCNWLSDGCTVKDSLAAHVLGVQSDENGHWEACTQEGCGHRTPSVAHVYTDDQDVTCDVCGHRRHVEHNSFASEWSYDDVNHWKACTVPDCDEQDQFGPHTYDNDQDATCNDCGYVRSVAPLPPSGGGGGSGGGSRERTYAVTLVRPAHGRVTADRVRAESGSTVTLTAVPDAGYTLQSLTATDGQGEAVGVREGADGRFTFTMPNRAVTVEAVFAPVPAAEGPSVCTGGAGCPSGAFPDLSAGKWYHEAVDYVLREGLMDGQGGLFHPNGALTRGMLAQILYNKEGRPPVNGASGFPDVAPGAWYADAVTWAASKGIVSGHADGRFAPTESITREQLAVMLWRYAGSPAPSSRELGFTDAESVSAYARDALAWAVEQGIVSGMGGGQLSPKGEATRAQAAQMLKNFLEK